MGDFNQQGIDAHARGESPELLEWFGAAAHAACISATKSRDAVRDEFANAPEQPDVAEQEQPHIDVLGRGREEAQ